MRCSIFYSTLVILGLSVVQVPIAEGCMCARKMVQEHYCSSDFVVVVNVTEFNILSSTDAKVKVELVEVIKATPSADQTFGDNVFLHTRAIEGLCGLMMMPGEIWIVSGRMIDGKPEVSSCTLGRRWENASERQRDAFRLLPELGC